jgi:hypothetical protein
VTTALGPLRESPRFLLSSRVVIHSPEGKRASDEFNQNVRGIVGQTEWEDLAVSPNLGGVVFLTRTDLAHLRENRGVVPHRIVTALGSAARTHETFVYAWPRSSKAAIYFIYGRDGDRLMAATRAFVRNDKPFAGLLVTE